MPVMPSGYAVMPQGQPIYPVAGLPNTSPQRWSVPPQRPAAMPAPPPLGLPPPPAFAAAVPPGQPRPKVRGVAAESGPPLPPAAPARIALPSPESLGIKLGASRVTATPAAIDWNHVHARLEKLGIVNYEHGRLPQGGFRVVLAVQTRQVEATGATEAAAVLLALQRAEGLVADAR